MQKHWLLPGVAVIGGFVGALLRHWQVVTAFEPDTGLVAPGSPATYALIIWSVLVAAALIVLCQSLKYPLPYNEAYAAEENAPYVAVVIASGLCLLVSAALEAMNLPVVYQTYQAAKAAADPSPSRLEIVLPVLLIALCVLGFLCVLYTGRLHFRSEGRDGKESLATLGLCLLFCVWLISDYQGRAADPVVLDYVFEIFAIISSLLGLYFMAGFSFQTGRPRRTVVFSLLGVYFSCVTLSDGHAPGSLLRFAFCILFLTVSTAVLIHNLAGAKPPEESEATTNE